MNPKIVSSLKNSSKSTKIYYSDPIEDNYNLLTAKSNECLNMIVEVKKWYTNTSSQKLDNLFTMPKAYWSIPNIFLNNRKIPKVSQLNGNGKTISNFERKAKPLNSHFVSKCTQVNNSSVLQPLEYKTNGRLGSVNIKEDDAYHTSKNFTPEKARGWDNNIN